MVDAYKVTHPRRLHSVPSLNNASQPDHIAPIVGYLTSQDNAETTARLFEISGGWAAETRWQRTGGHGFPTNVTLTPENILAKWDVFTNFGACLSVRRVSGWPLTSLCMQTTAGRRIQRRRQKVWRCCWRIWTTPRRSLSSRNCNCGRYGVYLVRVFLLYTMHCYLISVIMVCYYLFSVQDL